MNAPIFIDPENPIVRLCVEGMQAEAEYRMEAAHALFLQAWQGSTNDFEACIAAHYLARHQKTPEDMLYWNQEALTRAEAARDERVEGFYPSLYLNLGYSFEMSGEFTAAKEYYRLAEEKAADLPPGSYGEVVRDAIARGFERIRQKTVMDE